MLSHLGSVLSTLRTGWTPSSSVPRSRPWTLALALVVLVAWQFSFSAPGATDPTFRVWAATGLHANGKFVFFLRHLNLYPLATRAPIRADTREEAERILRTRPRSLVMDIDSTFRSGDRGRTLLFLVDSFLRAKTLDLSVRPATVLAWLLALCGLFVTFFRAGAPALGTCLVVALGSNIAATYEIYGAEYPLRRSEYFRVGVHRFGGAAGVAWRSVAGHGPETSSLGVAGPGRLWHSRRFHPNGTVRADPSPRVVRARVSDAALVAMVEAAFARGGACRELFPRHVVLGSILSIRVRSSRGDTRARGGDAVPRPLRPVS